MGMVPWRLYQEIATDLGIPAETMQQINILADGWYLTAGMPPFLQYDVPSQFGAGGSWLDASPTDAVGFCKTEYGSDAAIAAILRCVGAEVLNNTDSELETSFTLLAADIDDYLATIANARISPEVEKVRSYFNENKLKLQDFRETYDSEEPPQKYCDSCGAGIYEPFQYRCEECDARFPGWAALTYAEGEQQSTDAWREQMDVAVVTQNRHRHFVVLEADESLPGWIEEGGKVGQITDDGLTDLGKVVNTESRTIQVDHDTAAATGLVEGQQITICSSESNIGTTQQLGLLHEIRQDFAKWRSTADSDPVVDTLLSTVPTLVETLDQPTLSRPTEQPPTDTDSLAGFPLDESQSTVLKEICGIQPGELSLVVGPPGSGKTEVIAKAAEELAEQGERVLVTSHTNIAVDNVIEKLAKYSTQQVTRAGRPEKLSKGTQELMLSKVVEESDDATVQQLLDRVDELKAEISNQGGRASSSEQGELAELRRQIRDLQEQAEAESIKDVDITGATIIRSQLSGLAQVQFDTVIIDEASQIPVPLGILGMVNAKKWVVVGDHNQLQPVLKTIKTKNGSPPANASLFSFLRNRYDIERWLEYHYRSHEDIIGFVKSNIYDDRITVADLCPRGVEWDPEVEDIPAPSAVAEGPPVTFVDVNGEQTWRQRYGAAVNDDEVEVVGSIVRALVTKHEVEETDIGVITPFRGQRSRIADEISSFGKVEVSTVDGFQGRERDIIVFSTVNTEKGGLKFGGNKNRFTVASTRPKDRFIMVGNRTAITTNAPPNSLLRKYVDYATKNGAIFDWNAGDWSDGIDPKAAKERQERNEPERKEPNDYNQSEEPLETGLGVGGSGVGSGTKSGSTGGNKPTTGGATTVTTDPEKINQVEELIRLAPTTNGDLAEAWGLIDGREAWKHLTEDLGEYFKRNGNKKIVPTETAHELVETSDIE